MREKRYSTVHMLLAALAGGMLALATALLLLWFLVGPGVLWRPSLWGSMIRTGR